MTTDKKILHSFPSIDEEDISAVVNVLRSGHLEEGTYVRQFESAVAKLLGRKYAIATINGFSAIHLSLIALNIGKGDEVILPSYSCPAILNPVLISGAVPVFADIEENSFNIGLSTVAPLITSRTKAVIVPHTFGFPAPVDLIQQLGIPVIEDCAQSLGGTYKGIPLGSFTKLAIASFYSTKMVTACDAGMVFTDDESLADVVRDHVYYGHKRYHNAIAYNYHLTNLPAALGLSQVKKLTLFIEKRKKLAAVYDKYFNDISALKINFVNKQDSIYWRYPILYPTKRDVLKAELAENNIHTGFGVLEGLHLIRNSDLSLPRTDFYLQHILSLPIYPSLTEKDIIHVAENVRKLIK